MNQNSHHKTLGRVSELGWTPFGRLLVVGAVAGIVLAVFAPMLSSGGAPGTNTASAEILPAGCDTTIGSGSGFIQAVPNGIPVTVGTKITYSVGVGYPAPPVGVGCTAFNVNVFLQTPDGVWRAAPVCTLPTLASDAVTTLCPTTVDYTVTGTEAGLPTLRANLNAKGNKHDGDPDCIDANLSDPTQPGVCWGAQQTSVLTFVAPTPTPTNTPTSTSTLQASTATPTRVVRTSTPTNVPATNIPATSTPVVVNTVLSLVGPPSRPVSEVLTLPSTGSDPQTSSGVFTVPVVVAILAFVGSALCAFALGFRPRRSSE